MAYTIYCIVVYKKEFLKMITMGGINVTTNTGLLLVSAMLIFAIITSPIWLPLDYLNERSATK